jgi:hypothetical protein
VNTYLVYLVDAEGNTLAVGDDVDADARNYFDSVRAVKAFLAATTTAHRVTDDLDVVVEPVADYEVHLDGRDVTEEFKALVL